MFRCALRSFIALYMFIYKIKASSSLDLSDDFAHLLLGKSALAFHLEQQHRELVMEASVEKVKLIR